MELDLVLRIIEQDSRLLKHIVLNTQSIAGTLASDCPGP